MKVMLLIVLASIVVGCSSGPVLIRVKNCQPVGNGLFDCEEVPPSQLKGQ
jgi:hypothetical protein